MRVLVTGGLGRSGVWVCKGLAEQGHSVIALDASDDLSVLGPYAADVEVHTGDITDAAFLSRVTRIARPDSIAHLAGSVSPADDPAIAIQRNAVGTNLMLNVAAEAAVRRVVFTSSLAVYRGFVGAYGHPTYRPVDEDFPLGPMPTMRIYGATKILCEQLGAHYKDVCGIEFVALRFSHILRPARGLRNSPNGSSTERGADTPYRVLIDRALSGSSARVSGGSQKLDFIYIKDLARSIIAALTVNDDPTGAYNIASGELSTLHDVANIVRSIIPDADLSVTDGLDVLGFGPVYAAYDLRRANARLKFEPSFDLRAAITDYIAHERAV